MPDYFKSKEESTKAYASAHKGNIISYGIIIVFIIILLILVIAFGILWWRCNTTKKPTFLVA